VLKPEIKYKRSERLAQYTSNGLTVSCHLEEGTMGTTRGGACDLM
jgi:hypothetical protein